MHGHARPTPENRLHQLTYHTARLDFKVVPVLYVMKDRTGSRDASPIKMARQKYLLKHVCTHSGLKVPIGYEIHPGARVIPLPTESPSALFYGRKIWLQKPGWGDEVPKDLVPGSCETPSFQPQCPEGWPASPCSHRWSPACSDSAPASRTVYFYVYRQEQ